MARVDERLATLEEGKKNTEIFQQEMRIYMHEGRNWREETGKSVVAIIKNQEGMDAYQLRCDADRDNLLHDMQKMKDRQTADAVRISDTEKFQRRQIKVAVFTGLLVGGAGAGGTKLPTIFNKIMEWLS